MKTNIFSILTSFFLIYSNISQAQTTDEKNTILYCPKTVKCEGTSIKSCHLSDNPYNIWADPENGGKIHVGTYVLREAIIGSNGSFIGGPECRYYINERQPTPITVKIEKNPELKPEKNQNTRNIFSFLITTYSKWISNETSGYKCLSSDPTLCPLIEIPEITIAPIWRFNAAWVNFCIPNPNAEWESDYLTFQNLSYIKLHEICGATSNCIIDISNGYYCQHMGSIDIDISTPNVVKINKINTDQWVAQTCSFKKLEPFSTIYCQENRK